MQSIDAAYRARLFAERNQPCPHFTQNPRLLHTLPWYLRSPAHIIGILKTGRASSWQSIPRRLLHRRWGLFWRRRPNSLELFLLPPILLWHTRVRQTAALSLNHSAGFSEGPRAANNPPAPTVWLASFFNPQERRANAFSRFQKMEARSR
ncbi:hypothetical protein BC567DRAFT_222497 [Phyllosticta citribraziliensis]